LSVALTAEDVGDRFPDRLTAQSVLAWLAEHGWSIDQLQEHRAACQSAGVAWPHPLAAEQRQKISAARFAALMAEIRQAAGLVGPVRVRQSNVQMTAADRRLLQDVPPHHGAI